MNQALKPEVRSRVEEIDTEKAEEWGAQTGDGNPEVNSVVNSEKYAERTTVDSVEDGIQAFEKYDEYFQFILNEWESESDKLVMVPCGSQKPIGSSSIHQKKVEGLRSAGFLDECDLVIMSEPCTVIPHEYRLSLPAVNYDFPPEYTEEGKADRVFDIFVDNLATWLESCDYDVIYPYLVSRHMNKFTSAVEKADIETEVHEIPGASYNADTDSYSGDMFKSQDDVKQKLLAVRAFKSGEIDSSRLSDQHAEFYEEQFS